MKSFLLLLALPIGASAQKLEATAPAIAYHVGNEKAPLYRTATDTANSAASYLSPNDNISVFGQFSPHWAIVKRTGFFYLTPLQKLIYGPAENDKMEVLLGRPQNKAEKQALQALDAKNGFRDYRFDDTIDKFKNLKKQIDYGDDKSYVSTDENLKIGDAQLSDISYSFYKDKLYSVLIQTKGSINSGKVKAAFQAQYGPGFQRNRFAETYFWFGNKVTLYYDENAITHDAAIIISDNGISARIEADKKQAAIKAKSDL